MSAVSASPPVGGGLIALAGNSASADPVSLTLEYTCPFPLIGTQPISVEINSDIPSSIAVGEMTPPIEIEAITTVNAKTHQGLKTVAATTIEGSAIANANIAAPGFDLPLEVPIEVPKQNIPPAPPYTEFDITASGNAPEISFSEPGQGEITVGNIVLTLTPRKADGNPTGLKTFESACTLVAGQDVVLAQFEVTDGTGGDGTDDGTVDGTDDGTVDGTDDGTVDGTDDGTVDGTDDGTVDGTDDGTVDGTDDGTVDGTDDGTVDGTDDGTVDGTDDGTVDGTDDGTVDGTDDGTVDGTDDGTVDGTDDGTVDGTDDGTVDGTDDGSTDGTDGGSGEPIEYGYNLEGTSHIGTPNGDVPIRGDLDALFDLESGEFDAELNLAKTSGSFKLLGFLPSTADIAFEQVGSTTGTLQEGVLNSSSTMNILLPSVKLFGIPVGGGATCKTVEPSVIDLHSTADFFDPLSGGELVGEYALSAVQGCGPLNDFISPFMAGANNTLTINLTPKS
ncbi:DUF6801 domain-containing protein [Streptomyces specialis]|uniref:DUF6801 domain-containing protein n=1 Tax=Streptomyces specialis TaxID=498367 RepID=UPI00131D24E7|nr:DUF6801 domain-containing protein [Streptomyces specialis]